MHLFSICTILLVFIGYREFLVDGVALEIDLKLTNEQKKIMDKFKEMVIPKLHHQYMKEEIYLVRWLRARDFDLKKSEELLLQNLKWRKQQKMDTIHNEDWSDMQHDFPYYLDSFDKKGQPVAIAYAKEWDLRSAVVTGRIRRGLRYLDKAMDEANKMIRTQQLEGQNVTQFLFVLHMGHFNLYQHGCPRCITGILEFLDSYENHFPGSADLILLVDTPPVFDAIAQLVREAASPQTKEALKIYGINPKVWKKVLLDVIDADQLAVEFGGTRKDKNIMKP
ncbi:unnamed protein product [Orchesella dallaii]|uniref:CRAL-TRIO domain-containing protein n=1 Tax=Orchesella dallaii TaxID=48710 RepID=A0ABP1QSC4_9HEXA